MSTGLSSKVVFQAPITFRESSQPSCSLICSGSEPFRLEEQLLSVEGEMFLLTLAWYNTQNLGFNNLIRKKSPISPSRLWRIFSEKLENYMSLKKTSYN